MTNNPSFKSPSTNAIRILWPESQESQSIYQRMRILLAADPAHWTRIVGKSVLDEVEKWWSPYKSFSLPWEQFTRKQLF